MSFFCTIDYTAATFGNDDINDSVVVVDIGDPKPYESHVDISMFIRTRQSDGFIFYLGSDPFKQDRNANQVGESNLRSAKPQIFKPENTIDNEAPGISNITCELLGGAIQVTITSENGKADKFNLYSAKLSNGYRHFVRVIRQNNLMTVTVNESITINQDFPVAPTFTIEKLYLGNPPVRSNKHWPDPSLKVDADIESEVFGPDIESDRPVEESVLSSTISSTSTPEENIELSTHPTTESTLSSQKSSTTTTGSKSSTQSPNLITEAERPKLSTITSDTTTIDRRQGLGQVSESEVQQQNILSSNNDNRNTFKNVRPTRRPAPRRLLDNTEETENLQNSNEERTFSTAPLHSNPSPGVELSSTEHLDETPQSRGRREISEGEDNRIKKKFFKGIIQDVQITNGDKHNIRIVELFEQDFEETTGLEVPRKVGEAKVHHIKKGEISDETCNINPCVHGGTCQVTWNDYRCECQQGWKGRNCADKEYCYWNKCPGESTCVSLSDGFECLTNATFNGVSASVSFKPENFPNSSYSSVIENTIKATFRTKYITGGTILHIVGGEEYDNKYIRISIKDKRLSLEIPEGNKMLNESLEGDVLSGDWQIVEIAFAAGGGSNIKARLNNGTFQFITLESTIDFAKFITTFTNIIIGSSLDATQASYNNQKDIYTSEEIDSRFDSVQIHTNENPAFTHFFRGCIGEVRIAGVLLPFYAPSWLNETNYPKKKKFLATDINNIKDIRV